MPDIDVSDLLLDPDFTDTFTVTRQAQSVGTDGRAVIATQKFTIQGVVTMGSMEPFEQTQESIQSRKSITVHSQFKLLDPTVGFSPDIVTYNDNQYLVRKAYDWSRYGQGFFAAECDLKTPVSLQ